MNRQQVGVFLLSTLLVLSSGIAVGVGPGTVAAQEFDESDVEEVNANAIADTNDRIEETNDGLENVEDVELVAEVEAETAAEAEAEAQRLREAATRVHDTMLDRVVDEINEQAQDRVGRDIANHVDTAAEAREEADRIEAEYGHISDGAKEAADSLRRTADRVEAIDDDLNAAANTLAMPDTGTVEGTVTDDDGEPIEGVEIAAIESTGSTTSDEDGTYEIEVGEGDQPIRFSTSGYETVEETVTVEANGTAALDVSMAAEEDDAGGNGGDGGADGDVAGGALGSTVLDVGVLFAGVALVTGLALAVLGVAKRSNEAFVDLLRKTGATIGFMAMVGVAIGAAGYLSVGWVEVTFDQAIAGQLAPLIGLLVVFLVAPVLAIVLGLSEGRRRFSRLRLAGTTASSLIGGLFLVVLAMALISFSSDSEVATRNVIAIAGLVGAISAIGSSVAMVITGRSSLAT
ncbi:carboxypeptidase regulatory-like domain-containing protein [Halosolutus amylolyticus]|uniref:Carboxypeptidase regulatory-like domain-containing protein n=1 Tax=Halosolutus amylolyticus TaxID=2932267 RepID=A0ABD5PM84_9EURY|nr:carboxypeptidase regulatory-like domain-containing protein [Halosolutus amylolyticus]